VAEYLIDKSAYSRAHIESVGDRLEQLMLSGRVAVTGVAMLEILFSSRNHDDHVWQRGLLDGLARVPVNEAIVERSLEVQSLMSANGSHRSGSVPDLLIAACAEAHGLTVLHYDSDYDLIAQVTGQTAEWIVPAGTA
jgi:predicted nucleic acid-binding protein